MNATLFEKIELYLNGELKNEELRSFESELAVNKELASMVKLYGAIDKEMGNNERFSKDEMALKKTLNKLNATYFKSEPQRAKGNIISFKKISTLQWLPYSIAASVIIIAALFFLNSTSPRDLAKNYVAQNATILSLTMSSQANDTLQAGIAAYNNKDYSKALQLFKSHCDNHPQSRSPKEYIGFVYLVTNNYDSALHEFDELSDMKGLFSNPGTFLKAVTLLLRNEEGDYEQAKQLLQQVIRERLEGSRQAEEWLKKF